MRALEFTRLTEEPMTLSDVQRVTGQTNPIDQLDTTIQNIDDEVKQDPRFLDLVKKRLAAFKNKLSQLATKPTEDVEVLEDEQTAQIVDQVPKHILNFLTTTGLDAKDPRIKTQVDKLMRDLQDDQAKIIQAKDLEKEKYGDEMYNKGKIDAKNAVKAIFGDINDLAKKIVKYEEPGEDALTNKKAQQQAATELAKQKGMAVSLTAVFLEKVYMEEVLTQEDVNTFVKGCVNGEVLDMMALIKNDHGKIGDFVSETYKDTYTKMYPVLAKFKGQATTGGALGPGEVLLSAIGNPVGKEQSHGDLVVGSGEDAIAIEVKAGSSEKASSTGSGGSGARLNGTSIRKGSDAYKEIKDLFKKYKLDATARIPGGGSPLTIAPNSLNYVREQLNNDKLFKEYLKDVCKALVMNFDEVISPNAERSEKGRGGKIIHTDVLQKNKNTTPDVNFDHLLGSVITKDGLDFTAVMKLITYAQLTSYEATDGVQWVMTLDTHTENFSITKDPVDFINQIGINHVPAKNISISSKDPQTASFHWRSKTS